MATQTNIVDLPPPPVPADCDLRDFQFMPLDVARLRDSDLAALETPESCWAAVLLWCASWHQVPAASLPDDDRTLAKLAGYGRVVEAWMPVRAGALRGWVKCSDGRLYHSVVAEKAHESWVQKVKYAWRKECDRIRKANKQLEHEGKALLEFPPERMFEKYRAPSESNQVPTEKGAIQPEVQNSTAGRANAGNGNPTENPLKGEGQGEGQGQGDKLKTKPLSGKPDDIPPGFAKFWSAWPKTDRKAARTECLKRWKARGLEGIADTIVAHVEQSKKTKKWLDGFEPAPLTYINQRRWEDSNPVDGSGNDDGPGNAPNPDAWRNDPRFKGGK